MRGRERGGRRGREDEKGASPSKNTVGLETKSPPSEVSAAFSAHSLPAPPPPPLLALNFYCVFFFFFISFSSVSIPFFFEPQNDFFPLDPRGSEPAAGRLYPAWHRFHFISDEDVRSFFFLFGQKRHKSGQLALAPRRSS